MAKLTVKKVEALIKSGDGKTQRHADGEGLYLVVPASGTASWMLRFSSNKKRREMTLGKVRDLSLANARLEAATKMKLVREGFAPFYNVNAQNKKVSKPLTTYSKIGTQP